MKLCAVWMQHEWHVGMDRFQHETEQEAQTQHTTGTDTWYANRMFSLISAIQLMYSNIYVNDLFFLSMLCFYEGQCCTEKTCEDRNLDCLGLSHVKLHRWGCVVSRSGDAAEFLSLPSCWSPLIIHFSFKEKKRVAERGLSVKQAKQTVSPFTGCEADTE